MGIAAELISVWIPARVLQEQKVAAPIRLVPAPVVVRPELLPAAPAIPLIDAFAKLDAVRREIGCRLVECLAGRQRAEHGGEQREKPIIESSHATQSLSARAQHRW